MSFVRFPQVRAKLQHSPQVLEIAGPGARTTDVQHVPVVAYSKSIVFDLEGGLATVREFGSYHDHRLGQRVAFHTPAEASNCWRLALDEATHEAAIGPAQAQLPAHTRLD